jgi:hypothetical protein
MPRRLRRGNDATHTSTMRDQRGVGEVDRSVAARPPRRLPTETLDAAQRHILSLQARAGNSAVAGMLAVQRETDAERLKRLKQDQAELRSLFPKEKLMEGVVIHDYQDVNDELQPASYGAWTNSATDIYVRAPAALGATPQNQRSMLRYILQHEANHVRQFAQAKGPPKKWATMLQFEIEAYKSDKIWLAANGKTEIPDAKLLAKLQKGVEENLKNALEMQKTAAGQKDAEAYLFAEMKKRDFIPKGAKADPLELYQQ